MLQNTDTKAHARYPSARIFSPNREIGVFYKKSELSDLGLEIGGTPPKVEKLAAMTLSCLGWLVGGVLPYLLPPKAQFPFLSNHHQYFFWKKELIVTIDFVCKCWMLTLCFSAFICNFNALSPIVVISITRSHTQQNALCLSLFKLFNQSLYDTSNSHFKLNTHFLLMIDFTSQAAKTCWLSCVLFTRRFFINVGAKVGCTSFH